MEKLKKTFDAAKRSYDRGEAPLTEIATVCRTALQMLSSAEELNDFGRLGIKNYTVLQDQSSRSRPFLKQLMLDHSSFDKAWDSLIKSADTEKHLFQVSEEFATTVLYSSVMAFALCYDLWKPKSRKTPGTFLEVVIGSVLSLLAPRPIAERGKFIKLPRNRELVDLPESELLVKDEIDVSSEGNDEEVDLVGSVSTDIVFEFKNGNETRGIVIPAKITTRERIVQPFAHQRILDSAFGVGRYISVLVCVSETQRDDNNGRVNEICVPGTISLFQRYLANLRGIYYLDPPQRYLALSSSGVIEVHSVGSLLTGGFAAIIEQLRRVPAE